MQFFQGASCAEFLLVFLGDNNKDEERATLRIQISDDNKSTAESEFIKYSLELNSVPIDHIETGKDVIIDWELFGNFSTGNTLFVDANGLEMQEKFLYKRKEF